MNKSPVPRYADQYRTELETQQEAEQRLRQNPAVAEYLKQFYEDGDNFFRRYVEWRTQMLTKGVEHLEAEAEEARKLARTATQRLWQIQQRKLFVAQCQWRADELDLPAHGIETVADFGSWSQRIHECDWLPPIAPDEVEEYLAYLETDDCQDLNPYIPLQVEHWQFYDAYWVRMYGILDHGDLLYTLAKARMDEGGEVHSLHSLTHGDEFPYPMWYRWCDEHHQPPTPLLTLPDRRGLREGRYLSAAFRQQAPKPLPAPAIPTLPAPATLAAPATPPAPALRPLPPNDFLQTHYLLAAVETAITRQHYEACWYNKKARVAAFGWDLDEFLFTHMQIIEEDLLREGRILPIVAHTDYQHGLYAVWLGNYRERLQAAMRAEYAAYRRRQASGKTHPDPYPDPQPKAAQDAWRQEYHTLLLEGRALAGEPQNFDF